MVWKPGGMKVAVGCAWLAMMGSFSRRHGDSIGEYKPLGGEGVCGICNCPEPCCLRSRGTQAAFLHAGGQAPGTLIDGGGTALHHGAEHLLHGAGFPDAGLQLLDFRGG